MLIQIYLSDKTHEELKIKARESFQTLNELIKETIENISLPQSKQLPQAISKQETPTPQIPDIKWKIGIRIPLGDGQYLEEETVIEAPAYGPKSGEILDTRLWDMLNTADVQTWYEHATSSSE